jgi:hypothetical protein
MEHDFPLFAAASQAGEERDILQDLVMAQVQVATPQNKEVSARRHREDAVAAIRLAPDRYTGKS